MLCFFVPVLLEGHVSTPNLYFWCDHFNAVWLDTLMQRRKVAVPMQFAIRSTRVVKVLVVTRVSACRKYSVRGGFVESRLEFSVERYFFKSKHKPIAVLGLERWRVLRNNVVIATRVFYFVILLEIGSLEQNVCIIIFTRISLYSYFKYELILKTCILPYSDITY